MAIRVQNLPKKNFGQEHAQSLFHLPVSSPSSWNLYDQQFTRSLSKNLSLKVGPSPQLHDDAKHLCLQQPDQESSVCQSVGESHHELSIIGEPSSQCLSSESGQDQSHAKDNETQMKPVFLLSNPEKLFNPSQINYNVSMVCAQNPYADPRFTTPYGQNVHLGSQLTGSIANRVPLPFDLAEDGPIYVNPKQYHGIMRRRQYRARLEAQNKLVKNRKPYLHESRHQHALKRVRGSGGRFLSTKKLQQADSNSSSNPHCGSGLDLFQQKSSSLEFGSHCSQVAEHVGSSTIYSDITSVQNSNAIFRLPEGRFPGIAHHPGPGCKAL